ncbi:MAG: NfeD family protein [Oscillospiraceae bacterium]|nr:NfeD family protein [Oscillospiraceae bacterium]
MVWVWLGVTALAAFVEAVTMTLVSVWCVVGGLVAVFAAYFGASVPTQLLLFLGVSILTAAVVRPLAKKYADPHKVATNADRLLGMEAKVTEDIDNARSSGAVYVDGKTWTARSTDGGRISAGETVEIAGMEGVKLIVRAKAAVPTA